MYRLKSNVADFTVVDGKFAGRNYRAGETYDEIPPEEKNKFEKLGSEEAGKPGSEEVATSALPNFRSSALKEGGKK